MKRITICLLAALALAGCKQKGQTADATDSPQSEEQLAAQEDGQEEAPTQLLTPEQVAKDWAKQTIKLPGGGAPDIVALVSAFNKVWPSEATVTLLEEARDPKFTEYVNTETGGGIVCDRQNGYVNVASGDSDSGSMEAAVWKRTNGHRLFIINLVDSKPDYRYLPEKQALCIYDYDPKTGVMTPEENAISKFKASSDDTNLMYRLPKNGTEVSIGEGDMQPDARWHFFDWDGMKFTETISYTSKELEEKIVGSWMCDDEKLPLLTFNIVKAENGDLSVEDCSIYGSTEYEAYCNTWGGILNVSEGGGMEEEMDPAIDCNFRLTKQGTLTGTYYLRLNGGKETKGIMTLKRGNPAW